MEPLKFILIPIFFSILCSGKHTLPDYKSSIEVTVVDHVTKKPIAVRIRITDSNGNVPGLPKEAISVM